MKHFVRLGAQEIKIKRPFPEVAVYKRFLWGVSFLDVVLSCIFKCYVRTVRIWDLKYCDKAKAKGYFKEQRLRLL